MLFTYNENTIHCLYIILYEIQVTVHRYMVVIRTVIFEEIWQH